MRRRRGQCPPKHCEGSCRRRIKKSAHQAGGPGVGTLCGCPIGEELASLGRQVARGIRVGKLRRSLRRVAAAFVGEVRRTLAPPPKRRRKPVRFVPATGKHKQGIPPLKEVPFHRSGQIVFAPKRKGISNPRYARDLPYDPRVAGTPLEAASIAGLRSAVADVAAGRRTVEELRPSVSLLHSMDPNLALVKTGLGPVVPGVLGDNWPVSVDNVRPTDVSSFELSAILADCDSDDDCVVRVIEAPGFDPGKSWIIRDGETTDCPFLAD